MIKFRTLRWGDYSGYLGELTMNTRVLKSRRQKNIKGVCDTTKEIRRCDVRRTQPVIDGSEDGERRLCWKSHGNGFFSRAYRKECSPANTLSLTQCVKNI